jgi:P27 family predicted phage terminase small subunit
LSATGVLTTVDTGTLEGYCEAYATWISSKAEAERCPVLVNSRNDSVINPQVRIANMAMQQMIKLASELGITPASRSRIKLSEKKEDDDLAKFLRGEM